MAAQPPADKVILVIEDDDLIREGLTVALRRAGYAAVMAADCEEALERLRAGLSPAVILLDMLTPRLDGWRFLGQRQRTPALAAIPVVITTALPVASPEWASSLGADGYLQKPIETEALLAAVRHWCGPGAAGRGTIPDHGGVLDAGLVD